MYIYDKLAASDSDNILVIGQPMSGMTFAACKYAIEKAYEGKSVYIFKDQPIQLSENLQGAIKHVFKSLKKAYETIRGPYTGKVQFQHLANSAALGSGGDVAIYDNCSTLFDNFTSNAFKENVTLSRYRDLRGRDLSHFDEILEATTKENVIGCRNNPHYAAFLANLPENDYKDLMELPSDKYKKVPYTVSEQPIGVSEFMIHNSTNNTHTFTINSEGNYLVVVGDTQVNINKQGSITMSNGHGKVVVRKDGSVEVN